MTEPRNPAQAEMLRQVETIARECRNARRMRAALQFTWAMFLVTLALTVLLYALPSTAFPTGAAYVLWLSAAAAAGWRYVVLPLRSPITVEQVALFIDEHHPELENRIVTAVQLDSDHQPSTSDWMMRHFLAEALPKVSHTSFVDVMDQKSFARYGVGAVCMVVSSLLIAVSFNDLWFPNLGWNWGRLGLNGGSAAFTVEPGDTKVRSGDNVMVWVRGAESNERVEMRWQQGTGQWTSSTAQRSATDDVSFHEFVNVREPVRYQVLAGRAESAVFEITPWVPSEVAGIDLTYHYPDYLQRPEREVPNGGHITAVEGTEVDFSVRANRAVARAEMVLDTGDRVELESADGTAWKTSMALAKNGSYHIELFDEDGTPSEFNRKYSITVQRDTPPDVRVAFPRGDGTVSLLEEVPFDFVVTDDFGFAEYGIEYQVAGKEPVRIALSAGETAQTKAEGEHLLPLEDIPLEVGDLITWTVWAKDAKPDREAHELTGDPFFLEIRPFTMNFREAISNAGGGGGGGGGGGDAELLQKQRDIIIATWDLRRDMKYVDEAEFAERRGVIRDNQANLRDLANEIPMQGPDAQQIMLLRQSMQSAIDALNEAALPEPGGKLSEAATHEQRAYQIMLKLQGSDVEVGQQQSGGGGGGSQNERFGIDELEMDRNRNFYEEEQSSQMQEQAVDQLAQQLKELARRQKLIEEEIAKLISELQLAKTEEEREELRRRLERLEEEMRQNLEQLDESQRQMASSGMQSDQAQQAQRAMNDAREQMNRSLENLEEEKLQEARASSTRAGETLKDLEDQLRQLSGGSAAERLEQMQEELRDLQEQQHGIAQKAAELREQHNAPSFEGQENLEEKQRALEEEKSALAQDFVELMNRAGDLAERSRESQELMSRALGDWLRETAKDGILESIEESQPLVKYGVWDSAASEEQNIAQKFDKAVEGLDEVAEKLVKDELESKQKALQELQELLEQAEQLTGNSAGGEEQEQGQGAQPDEEGEQQARAPGDGEPQDGQSPGEGEPQDGQQTAPGEGDPKDGDPTTPGEGQGEQSESESRTGRGERPSEEPGEASGEDEQGEQRADGRGGENGEPGDARGQRGEQPSESEEQSEYPGTEPGEYRESPMQVGSGMPGEGAEERMRQFIEEDYAGWLDQLQDAEALLPEGSEVRGEVTRVRESIESWRRTWRSRALAPQFDLFVEMAEEPLREAASRLQRELAAAQGENTFVLVDEGEVPHQYRTIVADYFKELSAGDEEP